MGKVLEFSKVDNNVRITLEVDFSRSMLDTENLIQDALNEAGRMLTAGALEHMDTDGSPIRLGSAQMTSKGKVPKEYETPYGKVNVSRHVYQSSDGGKTFCPMDFESRIVNSSTPRFAGIVSFKFANTSVSGVVRDLEVTQRRHVSRDLVHETSAAVASIVEAKDDVWTYDLPRLGNDVSAIGISIDGTCVNIRHDGWRQAMVGTIALYDSQGERLFTQYLGESPEIGKSRFHAKFQQAVEELMKQFSSAKVVGIADGAKDNWSYLSKFTTIHCLDYYHASEYVSRVAIAAFHEETKRDEWLKDRLHNLKHETGYAEKLIEEMGHMRSNMDISANRKDEIRVCQNYFENNKGRMVYADHVACNLPIGSGVVEAGCKVLVKERLCGSGMRWDRDGCADVLRLRSLALTDGRWEQFWKKVDRFGTAA